LFKRIEDKVGGQGQETRHPTMRRAKTSMTNATQTKPRQVAVRETRHPELIRSCRGEVSID
jgi:hypothetical protein